MPARRRAGRQFRIVAQQVEGLGGQAPGCVYASVNSVYLP